MIKILLVDDSAIIRTMLKQILEKNPELIIVGEASNGAIAIEKNDELKPDLIIMDIHMPVMDGIEATSIIMKKAPTKILIFTTEDSARLAYEALSAGAIEILQKPNLASLTNSFYAAIDKKVMEVAKGRRFNKIEHEITTKTSLKFANKKFSLVAIGASTGGPVAVLTVLKDIGPNFPLPIFVTQHIDSSFDSHYAEWLSENAHIPVVLASEGLLAENGCAYVAPADRHLEVYSNGDNRIRCHLSDNPPLHYLRPAVDYLFDSSARNFGKGCISILLTGMGKDGAIGSKAIFDVGGVTIAESEKTCVVYGMPKAAVEMGGIRSIVELQDIGNFVKELVL